MSDVVGPGMLIMIMVPFRFSHRICVPEPNVLQDVSPIVTALNPPSATRGVDERQKRGQPIEKFLFLESEAKLDLSDFAEEPPIFEEFG